MVCTRCDKYVTRVRYSCPYCNEELKKPITLLGPYTPTPGVSYCQLVARATACLECRKADGTCFEPWEWPKFYPPVPTCQNPVCGCTIQEVFDDGAGRKLIERGKRHIYLELIDRDKLNEVLNQILDVAPHSVQAEVAVFLRDRLMKYARPSISGA